jgi:carbon starvation protein CstA
MWQNMGYPLKEKTVRSFIIWLIFLIVIIVVFALLIYFDTLSTQEQNNFVIPATCPAAVSKESAVRDVHQEMYL